MNHIIQWFPLTGGAVAALAATMNQPPWVRMWALALAIYLGFKWATWHRARRLGVVTTRSRTLAYLLLWPGMDARTFLDLSRRATSPLLHDWAAAALKIAIGLSLIWAFARQADSALAAGWTGMIGLMFLLHFGLITLLAYFWQSRGVIAPPLMDSPFLASTLSEFWGHRWNTGFRVIAFQLMFQPLLRYLGLPLATLGTFLLSGLIHDLVISVPIGGGYGGPTLYFLIQGLALLLERTPPGRRFIHPHHWTGHVFTLVTVALPIGLLFPQLFVEQVILPFLQAIGAL